MIINNQRKLIIFIVGTTSVGKTKLSIQISNKFNGQIISCDSKQLYKHADILTAKSTPEQQAKAKHHMIDCLNLTQKQFNRNKYFRQAMKKIQEIRNKGKIPVIVGGTNYYLETLLYNIEILEDNEHSSDNQQKNNQNQKNKNQQKDKVFDKNGLQNLKSLNLDQKYLLLKKIDPKMAQKLHQNDNLRVTNFLQKYYIKGTLPSTSYKPYVTQLRFPQQTILFWIRNSNKQEQRELIKKRVHQQMINTKGIIEILSIFTFLRNNQIKQAGITQTIGYKEFEEFYLEIQSQIKIREKCYNEIYKNITQQYQNLLQKHKNKNNILAKLKNGQNILIKNTIDYSKRQITWIKNRIFQSDQSSNFFILELSQQDCQDDQKIEQNKKILQNEHQTLEQRFIKQVQQKSFQIIQLIYQKGIGSIKENIQMFKKAQQYHSFQNWKKHICQICHQEVNGQHQWNQHLKSKKHIRKVKGYEKMQKIKGQIQIKKLNAKAFKQKQRIQKQDEKQKQNNQKQIVQKNQIEILQRKQNEK